MRTHSRPESGPPSLIVPVGVGTAVILVRVLSLTSIENDHFVHLARAHQILRGAWPIRDFVDPGQPLTYGLSWAAARVAGPTLLPEVLLCAGMLALAAALTFWLARHVSDSTVTALVVTALQVVAWPRLYNYPKILIYVVAAWLAWRYVEHPGRRRLAALAAWTAVAFLFRHDHGLYAGLGAVAWISAVHARAGLVAAARPVATFAAVLAACLLPWLAYVEVFEGLRAYVASAADFSRAEAQRAPPQWPRIATGDPGPLFLPDAYGPDGSVHAYIEWAPAVTTAEREVLEQRYRLARGAFKDGRTWRYTLGDTSHPAVRALVKDPAIGDTYLIRRDVALGPDRLSPWSAANVQAVAYYLLLLVPLATLALEWAGGGVGRDPRATFVVGLAVLVMLVALGFLRDALEARLPDVFGPVPILIAALAGLARGGAGSAGARGARAAIPALLLLAPMAVVAVLVGDPLHHGYQTHVLQGPRGFAPHARTLVAGLLTWPWAAAHPQPGDLPLATYLHACTAPDDRVLAAWFAPELPMFARRGFAGGLPMWVYGYYERPVDQDRIVAQLGREAVPIVLIPAAEEAAFRAHYPRVADAIDARFEAWGTRTIGTRSLLVLVERARAPAPVRAGDGLPCFAPR